MGPECREGACRECTVWASIAEDCSHLSVTNGQFIRALGRWLEWNGDGIAQEAFVAASWVCLIVFGPFLQIVRFICWWYFIKAAFFFRSSSVFIDFRNVTYANSTLGLPAVSERAKSARRAPKLRVLYGAVYVVTHWVVDWLSEQVAQWGSGRVRLIIMYTVYMYIYKRGSSCKTSPVQTHKHTFKFVVYSLQSFVFRV